MDFSKAPDIDITKSATDLIKLSSQAGSGHAGAEGLPDPNKGPNGTIYIASDFWASYMNRAPSRFCPLYFHELGNILSYRLTSLKYPPPPSYVKYGNPNGIGEAKDTDTGAKLQLCIFGRVAF